jgi:hypothetical protein
MAPRSRAMVGPAAGKTTRMHDHAGMKLAFVTSLVPNEQPATGFEIANAAILAALRAEGHHVTVIGFARPEDRLPEDPSRIVLGRMVIENHAASGLKKLGWLIGAVRHGLPVASAKLRQAGSARALAALTAAGPFDAVVLNAVAMPGATASLGTHAPSLLVAHNLEHRSAEQNAEQASSPLMRWLYRREARHLQRIEAALAKQCAFVWCLAEEDRLAWGPAILGKSATLPLVAGHAAVPPPASSAPRHDVGLIGTWTWEPNLIGLRWFLDEVVPRLPPSLTIAVAGRAPPGLPTPPQVRWLGRVADAAAFLCDCAVVALTSRAGTGVQLKTIEALQLGRPAVATGLSLRGFTSWPPNVVRADSAEDFADSLARHVAAARAGTLPRVDPALFLTQQTAAMHAALCEGLQRIGNKTAPGTGETLRQP